MTIEGEILHYKLGTKTVAVPGVLPGFTGAYTPTDSTNGNVVRVGLNFKFDTPAVPVVARS